MRILLVSQYFWPESFIVNDLVTALTERGHEVTVLTGKPNYPTGTFFEGYGFFGPVHEEYGDADVVRVPLIPRGPGGNLRLMINYFSYALSASVLGPLLCRRRYDVILVYEPSPITVGLPAAVLKLFKRVPIMFWVQDLWPESISATGAIRSPAILRQVERLVRFVYRSCDLILLPSEGAGPRVQAVGAKASKLRYWPQWAQSHYRPVEVEEDAGERREMPEGFNVVFGGNIGAAQSFETILAAAKELAGYPDIHWVVIGEGRMKPWVQQEIKRLGLSERVHLLGSRAGERMPYYFALADALLVPLKKDPIFTVTVPTKVQAYLACGRPIVASLDGDAQSILRASGAGVVAEAENGHALAEKVLEIYRMSPEEREAMGERGRKYFEDNFEREMLLDHLEVWMEEVVGSGT